MSRSFVHVFEFFQCYVMLYNVNQSVIHEHKYLCCYWVVSIIEVNNILSYFKKCNCNLINCGFNQSQKFIHSMMLRVVLFTSFSSQYCIYSMILSMPENSAVSAQMVFSGNVDASTQYTSIPSEIYVPTQYKTWNFNIRNCPLNLTPIT